MAKIDLYEKMETLTLKKNTEGNQRNFYRNFHVKDGLGVELAFRQSNVKAAR